jgi:DNA-binding NtrC family response regulator
LVSKIAQTGKKKRKNRHASDDAEDDITFKDMMQFMLRERELEMRTRREDRDAAERARQEEIDLRRQEVRMMNMMMMSMLSGQHTHHHRSMVNAVCFVLCLSATVF